MDLHPAIRKRYMEKIVAMGLKKKYVPPKAIIDTPVIDEDDCKYVNDDTEMMNIYKKVIPARAIEETFRYETDDAIITLPLPLIEDEPTIMGSISDSDSSGKVHENVITHITTKFKPTNSKSGLPPINSLENKIFSEYTRRSKIFSKFYGMIYGGFIGECYGMQFKGRTKVQLKTFDLEQMPTKPNRGVRPNDWGSMGDQMGFILELMYNNYSFNKRNFAKKLKYYKSHGLPELSKNQCSPVDPITSMAISDNLFLRKPTGAATIAYNKSGRSMHTNGAIGRGAVLSLLPNWAESTIKQTITTHVSPLCIYASYLHTRICRIVMNGQLCNTNIFNNTNKFLKNPEHLEEFKHYFEIYNKSNDLTSLELDDMSDKSHVLKALGVSFLTPIIGVSEPFEDVLANVASYGGDTDINCAIAGQVYGAMYGWHLLDQDYLTHLNNRQWIDRKVVDLIDKICQQQTR